jgi:hypothetical protein
MVRVPTLSRGEYVRLRLFRGDECIKAASARRFFSEKSSPRAGTERTQRAGAARQKIRAGPKDFFRQRRHYMRRPNERPARRPGD